MEGEEVLHTQNSNPQTDGVGTNEGQGVCPNQTQQQEQHNQEDINVGSNDYFCKKMVNGEEKAECNYCKAKLGAKSSNGPHHLLVHMEKCPKRKNKDLQQQVLATNQRTMPAQSNLSCYNFDAYRSRKDLANMVIVHEYPLSIVEHHGFRKSSTFFKVPSRNTLKYDILKIFYYEKQKTMRILETNASRIAITTDIHVDIKQSEKKDSWRLLLISLMKIGRCRVE
ncbi:hypothetical protein OSB04_017021 [Centaurea solstitialis]|uniref:BED-type domain-containing protein n=1 Tax=Centaurea solstitialis TaxID=347529 RepID=A0AA38TFB3_9ASTR|nr:hypothetical protein OSB04_017021 [Centaurea solstitialis]